MTGDNLDGGQDIIGPVPETDPKVRASAEQYIRRHALDQDDADLLFDALLGPLTTRQGGREGSKAHARGAA